MTQRKGIIFRYVILSTILGLSVSLGTPLSVVSAQEAAQAPYRPPQFRTVATDQPRPNTDSLGTVRLVTDADFAPYSFLTATGAPAGLAVEMALAACTSLAIRCTVTALPFAGLLPALASGEADAVIAGPRLDEETARTALSTRAYFRIMGRFAAQAVNPLANADAAALAGRRIGVIRDTLHARWLEAYYPASEIVAFDDGAKAGEALRTGAVEALFGDNLQMIYWVSGAESGACCRLRDGD